MTNLKRLLAILLLAGCKPQPTLCEMLIVDMHEDNFERRSGVRKLNCERDRSRTLTRCSGTIENRPVRYRCDPDGCDWECENCR